MSHSSYSDLRPFLDRLNGRSILSDTEQSCILALPTRVKQVERNRDFVGLGERVDHACYVLDGLVGRFDQNGKGDRQITALHIGGDMPDLHSVVQPTATSALQTLSTSTILEIPHVALRQIAGSNPAIGEAFWRDCMVDSMITTQWVVNVGRRDARSRIAHLLCEMACRYKVAPDEDGSTGFALAMTQTQLGDATGLTPVHVNRTLKRLSEIGTTFSNGWVEIRDWKALVEAGDFDRSYLQDETKLQERIKIAN